MLLRSVIKNYCTRNNEHLRQSESSLQHLKNQFQQINNRKWQKQLSKPLSEERDASQPSDSTPSKPIVEFGQIFNKQELEGFHQAALFQVLSRYINDLSHVLLAMVDMIPPILHASRVGKKGVIFWVAEQVVYTHPTKELVDTMAKYLSTGMRSLFHRKDLEAKIDEVLPTILLRRAH